MWRKGGAWACREWGSTFHELRCAPLVATSHRSRSGARNHRSGDRCHARQRLLPRDDEDNVVWFEVGGVGDGDGGVAGGDVAIDVDFGGGEAGFEEGFTEFGDGPEAPVIDEAAGMIVREARGIGDAEGDGVGDAGGEGVGVFVHPLIDDAFAIGAGVRALEAADGVRGCAAVDIAAEDATTEAGVAL